MQNCFLAADEEYTHFINSLEGWNNIDLKQVMVQSQITEMIMRSLFMEILGRNKVVSLRSVSETAFTHSFDLCGNYKIQKKQTFKLYHLLRESTQVLSNTVCYGTWFSSLLCLRTEIQPSSTCLSQSRCKYPTTCSLMWHCYFSLILCEEQFLSKLQAIIHYPNSSKCCTYKGIMLCQKLMHFIYLPQSLQK